MAAWAAVKADRIRKAPVYKKDDMQQIYPVYREADVVVLASPMYYWEISGQLKCAFDRLFAVAECSPDYENPKKECLLTDGGRGTRKVILDSGKSLL